MLVARVDMLFGEGGNGLLSLDRRRALGAYFWIAIGAALILQVHSVSYLLRDDYGDALMCFFLSSSLGFVAPVMPLVAALPFGTAFCADFSSGYVPSIVTRSGKRRYLWSKSLTCAVSGGLVNMCGMLAFILLLNVKFPQNFQEEVFLGDIAGLETLLLGGGFSSYALYYLARLVLAFFSGAFWAMTAMTFSAFYPNVALTLCAPLVAHRLLQEIGYATYVPSWLNVTLLEVGAVELAPWQVVAVGVGVFAVLTALLAAVFAYRAGRRLRYA